MRKIVALMALMLAGLAIANGAPSGINVEVALDQAQFLPGEDLTAAVRITNLSGQEIELGNDNRWLTFNVQGDGSYIVPPTGAVPVTGKFTLQSAQVATRRVNITPYFNFTRQGRYRLTATVNLPQWKQQVTSKVTTFMIMTGVRLVNVPDLEFGVPPKAGEATTVPEIRRYVLEKAAYLRDMKLYLRITDGTGNKTLRVFPIDRMVSFSTPEAQIDGHSDLHVLHQTGARAFNYSVINPDGDVVLRQTYQYTSTRPALRKNDEGKIFVGGGVRIISAHDFPPVTASIPATKTDAKTATP
ncbi:MAG: hypothetical protein ACXWBP_08575 [Limisphaerales bacterium]